MSSLSLFLDLSLLQKVQVRSLLSTRRAADGLTQSWSLSHDVGSDAVLRQQGDHDQRLAIYCRAANGARLLVGPPFRLDVVSLVDALNLAADRLTSQQSHLSPLLQPRRALDLVERLKRLADSGKSWTLLCGSRALLWLDFARDLAQAADHSPSAHWLLHAVGDTVPVVAEGFHHEPNEPITGSAKAMLWELGVLSGRAGLMVGVSRNREAWLRSWPYFALAMPGAPELVASLRKRGNSLAAIERGFGGSPETFASFVNAAHATGYLTLGSAIAESDIAPPVPPSALAKAAPTTAAQSTTTRLGRIFGEMRQALFGRLGA